MTLDVRVVSSSSMLGVEITSKQNLKKKKCVLTEMSFERHSEFSVEMDVKNLSQSLTAVLWLCKRMSFLETHSEKFRSKGT